MATKLEKELKIKGRSVEQIKGAKKAQLGRLGKMSPNVGRKKCRKGKSCGASCIHAGKVCLVDIPNAIAQYMPQVVKEIQNRAKAKEPGYVIRPVAAAGETKVAYPGKIRTAQDIEAYHNPRIERYRREGKEDLARREESRRNERIGRLAQNNAFAERLAASLPSGVSMTSQGTGIALTATTKAGHKVEFTYSGGDIGFKVNKSNEAGKVKGKKAQLEVASTVRSMYDALMGALPAGTVVWTKAFIDDGKGAMRESALSRVGFSKPEFSGEAIFARKTASNRMVAASEVEFDRYKEDKGSVYFAEAARDVSAEVKDWYQILFGTPL